MTSNRQVGLGLIIVWMTVTAHFKMLEVQTSDREIKTCWACRVRHDIKEAKIVGNPSRKNEERSSPSNKNSIATLSPSNADVPPGVFFNYTGMHERHDSRLPSVMTHPVRKQQRRKICTNHAALE